MSESRAKFTSGSTMRHVVVMTTSGMIGMTFMFLVDAVTLFWVSQLEVEMFMAAISFAWAIQFFTIAFAVGFMIAAAALVARSLGQEKFEQARKQASVSIVITLGFLSLLSAIICIFRVEILTMVGASGESLETAALFLLISVPTLPFMGLGMIGSSILRAEGDALRSMAGTMSTGAVAMIVDPLFIFGFDMGVQGAALGISVSRILSAVLVMYFVIVTKNLLGRINGEDIRIWWRPFAIILLPTIVTQLASPTGNLIATEFISEFGEAAVAGWGIMNRVLILAFGGVFSLSAAIGGIIGQNYGALLFDRVRTSYRDAMIFSTIYVSVVWMLLMLLNPVILSIFNASDAAGEVVQAFNFIAAGGFIFAGFLYVSNASFNNLGKPIYSTYCNWIKDGICIYPLCLICTASFGAVGVVYAVALAWVISGTIAGIWGWRFIDRAQSRALTSART